MCQAGGGPGRPASVADALAMLDRALDALAGADASSLPTGVQADVLRALECAQSRQVAVRARVLSAFMAQDGCAADGQGTAKAWLRWQTRITRPAAAECCWCSTATSPTSRDTPTRQARSSGLARLLRPGTDRPKGPAAFRQGQPLHVSAGSSETLLTVADRYGNLPHAARPRPKGSCGASSAANGPRGSWPTRRSQAPATTP